MPRIKTISAEVALRSTQQETFSKVTDWELQNKWIFATKVTGIGSDSQKLHGKLEAFTGIGSFGVLDTMTITKWDPPQSCEVTHTGKYVKGKGLFEVYSRDGSTYFRWTEYVHVPFGLLGSIGWVCAWPLLKLSLGVSLRRFRKLVED